MNDMDTLNLDAIYDLASDFAEAMQLLALSWDPGEVLELTAVRMQEIVDLEDGDPELSKIAWAYLEILETYVPGWKGSINHERRRVS